LVHQRYRVYWFISATGILEQTLIERFGADIRLPDLREELAQCERRGKKTHDAYMVHYLT
jgi:hypothetical protein